MRPKISDLFNFLKPKDQFEDYAQNMKPLQNVTGSNDTASPFQNDEQGSALYKELMKNTNSMVQNTNTQPAFGTTLCNSLVNNGQSTQEPTVTPIQVNQDGSMNTNVGTHSEVPVTWKDKFKNAMFGTPAYTNNESIDTSGGTMNATISSGPRRGGFYNDIVNGAKENYATGFAAPNLTDNMTSDGRRKGFAYRLGETFGTLGRFAESAPGRALITAGLVGLTGGDGLDALAYGGQAGALNQQNRMKDKLYRQSLQDNYGYTPEQLSNIRGYVGDSAFKNLSDSNYKMQKLNQAQSIAQMKDNTSRAKMIGTWLKNGQITLQEASSLIAAYGITQADFQESNETRKTDSQIELNDEKIENMRNPKPKIYKTYRYGTSNVNINHTGGKSGNGGNGNPLGLKL